MTAAPDHDLGLRPLSARSVVLSLLLGTHPPELPVRHLVRAAHELGITDATLRVALTRMVGAGDLVRTETVYRLSERLLDRQRRQDDAIHPATHAWRGDWEIAVVTAIGRPAAERADLRAALTGLRLAELREGVWLRPANLRRKWPADLDPVLRRLTGTPDDDPVSLARSLWDVTGWAAHAHALLTRFDTATDPAARITVAAAIVRHLLADPVLPADLRPPDWPADALRSAYDAYKAALIRLLVNHTGHA